MIEVYIDGGSAGNPGPSGAGVFVKNNGEVIRQSIYLPIMTNHEAEFHAFIEALKLCKKYNFTVLSVRSDSQILVDGIEKKYVKNLKYKPLLSEILKEIEHSFEYVFVKWIPNKLNGEADKLAKQAIRREQGKVTD